MNEAERHEMRRKGMRVSDVARECDVRPQQVYQYIADGELAAWDAAKKDAKRRDWRIRRPDFEKFYATRFRNADAAA